MCLSYLTYKRDASAVEFTRCSSQLAPLPRFSSLEGENLELFLRQFEETISKFVYTEYDKLLLLKQQVSGKASLLIDSLEADSQTYSEAKKLLMSALASKSVQIFNVIKQMCELRLTYTSEPFQYISDIRKIMQAFQQLSIMQYFFFTGLNESFKNHLILLTNNIRPTLSEIMIVFTANERYSASQKLFNSNKNKPDSSLKSTSLFATRTETVVIPQHYRYQISDLSQ